MSIPPASARGFSGRRPGVPTSARGDGSARHASASGRRPSASSSARGNPSVPRSRRGSEAGNLTGRTSSMVNQGGNAMKVYVRVRPYSERELAQRMSTHSTVRIDSENPTIITLLEPAKEFRPLSTHSFSRCFWSVFEASNDDLERTRTMEDLRDTVDTYLNGGMNARRQSNAPEPMSSRERRASMAKGYVGAGSTAGIVQSQVSHPPYASQKEVYDYVGKPILENAIDGYNGCIFAYGQTGSGKTFTMMGYAPGASDIRARRQSMSRNDSSVDNLRPASDMPSTGRDSPRPIPLNEGDDVVDVQGIGVQDLQGIIPRVCTDLFDGMHAKSEDGSVTFKVEVAYYEIYNEKVFDLIRPQRSADLRIRQNPITGPYVEGLAMKTVKSEEDVARIIRKGMQERHTAATQFNDRSSRSHAILSLSILQLYLDESNNTCKMTSKLNLVDLAGSERTGAAGAEGTVFADGVNINLSLSVLGRVIDALADLSQNKSLAVPIPYRDSNLTWLLSDSLGGNSQTSMIATISPHMINYEEMRQTIRYASRAKQIVNRAVRNEDPQVVQIRELRNEVERLQQLLKDSGAHDFTKEYVLGLEKKCRELEKKCAEQEMIIVGLRAELESAGIADPTLVVRGRAGSDARAPNTVTSGAELRKANETMQRELADAHQQMQQLEDELRRRAAVPTETVKQYQHTIETLERELALLRGNDSRQGGLWARYGRAMEERLRNVADLMDSKTSMWTRECGVVVLEMAARLHDSHSAREMQQLVAANEMQKRFDEELAQAEARYRSQLDNIHAEMAKRDQERDRLYQETNHSVEEKLRSSRDAYDQERRRMEQEKDNLKVYYEDLLAKARLGYQEELQKLRASLGGGGEDRARLNDALRAQQEEFDAELERMRADADLQKKNHDADVSKLRARLTNEATRREAEVAEKDRQRRTVEAELVDLRRDNLRIQNESKKAERDLQAKIKDIVQQQETLFTVVGTAVSNWENQSPSLDVDMRKLRDLMADKETQNFRLKAKTAAFRPRSDLKSRVQEVEEKKQRENEEYKDIISQIRQTQDSKNETMQALQKDIYEKISRIRGMQTGGESIETGDATPPPANGNDT